MVRAGITGGIGSGKTTVCKIFETIGIPVYYADDRAKWLMTHDDKLVAEIKALLGEAAYDTGGQLNRAYIAGIIFEDAGKLQQLNQLVHPAVATDVLNWQERQTDVPYTLKEAALLFESSSYLALDFIICVYAPEAMRLTRVMERDDVTAEVVKARMNKQWPDQQKMELSDFVIYNDGSRSLIAQVLEVHELLSASL